MITDAEQVRRTLDTLVEAGSIVARSDGVGHELFPVAISGEEIDALRIVVEREAPDATIEIGFGYGLSALAICEGVLRAGRTPKHLVIDPFQAERFSDCGHQVVHDAGLHGSVEHLDARSELALPRLVERGARFDLAFVDGNHRFDAVFVDLFYLARLVRPGGVIALDDYQLPGIVKAADFYVANLGWTIEGIGESDRFHRWAVLRTATEPHQRGFEFFRDF